MTATKGTGRKERKGWSALFWRAIESPLTTRALVVAYVVAGLYAVLGILLYTRLIPDGLRTLLQRPMTEGAVNTVTYTFTIIPIGALIGFLVGWARLSHHPLLSWPASVYVNVIRGVPPLVMILFAYFWLPFAVLPRGVAFQAGLTLAVFALAVHTSAYQAEIFRAGFQSLPRGQVEAAEALGLSKWQAMRYVILPQAFRVTLPALGNEFANVVKDSSLLAIVAAFEMSYWGRNNQQYAFGHMEWVIGMWIVIAAIYFVITYIITQVVAAVEHRYRVPGLGSVSF